VRRFEGAVAVVTGGGQGIGAAIANALATEGAAVVVAARRSDRVEHVATEIRGAGGKAWAVHCDVTDPASVNDLAKAASRHAGGGAIDILVNNAGVAHSAPLAKTTLEDWNRVLAVNATGTFLCTRAFISGMLERKRGSIVNVASVAGLTGGGGPLHRRLRRGQARRDRFDRKRRSGGRGNGRHLQRGVPGIRGHGDDRGVYRARGRQNRQGF
jgi:NAD(P)-dependent dehydrogenase (short-subunit alcohol dehydrogenase family)